MRLIDADALTKKYCKQEAKGDCKNCDWWGDSWCRCEIYGVQIDACPTIDPDSLRPKWISVEDRLPEEGGLYITFGCTAVPVRWLHNFDKDIGKFGAWWNYEPDGKEHPRYRFIEAGNITHWIPIPEPPDADMRGAK